MPLIYVISIASDEYLLATRPWPGGENKIDGRISYRTDFEAIGAFLLPCAAPGVSLRAVWRGAPRGAGRGPPPCPSRMMRRAERTVESGIMNVPRALSVSPRVP